MIKRYKCINSFQVDKYDNDGFDMEELYCINEGDIYKLDVGNPYLVPNSDLHLDLIEDCNGNKDVDGWLEIPKEVLEEYFEDVK